MYLCTTLCAHSLHTHSTYTQGHSYLFTYMYYLVGITRSEIRGLVQSLNCMQTSSNVLYSSDSTLFFISFTFATPILFQLSFAALAIQCFFFSCFKFNKVYSNFHIFICLLIFFYSSGCLLRVGFIVGQSYTFLFCI